jgi:small GTP-binding protein
MADYDLALKLIVGGEGGAGKTTLLYRFINGKFMENSIETIGVGFYTKTISDDVRSVSLVLWDLSGQERFRPMFSSYMKGADGGFICFDMSKRNQLPGVENWINEYSKSVPELPTILIGTKLDLVQDEDVDLVEKEAIEFVENHGLMAFIPTSSKTGFNVDEAVELMVNGLVDSILGRSGAKSKWKR